jgi:hypothetical protein
LLGLLVGFLFVEQKTFKLCDPAQRDLVVTLELGITSLLLEKDTAVLELADPGLLLTESRLEML